MLKDFIPRSDEELLEWAGHFIAYVAGRRVAFRIEEDAFSALRRQFETYRAAYTATAFSKRGGRDIQAKITARDELAGALRFFVTVYIAVNPAVSNADRDKMRLPHADAGREAPAPPATFPEIEASGAGPGRLTLRFKDSGSGKRARPKGAHSIGIRWATLSRFPASVEELTTPGSCNAGPYTLAFKDEERGRVCYLSACWANNRGEKGPWGIIAKALIP